MIRAWASRGLERDEHDVISSAQTGHARRGHHRRGGIPGLGARRAVDRLLFNRTGIIIAHRLATVLRADDILILEDGRIHEYGELEELRNNPHSRFAELLRTGMEEVLV